MNILFISPLDINSPSSIHRCKMVSIELKKRGYDVNEIYKANKIDIISNFFRADLVIFQRYTYYLAPLFLILLKIIGKKVIFDFDDSIFSSANIKNFTALKGWLLRKYTNFMISHSNYVVVGSHFLLDYSKKLNHNSILIPTPVDINLFSKNLEKKSNEETTVGFFGSGMIHLSYLYKIKEVLNKSYLNGEKFKLYILTGNYRQNIQAIFNDAEFKVEYGPEMWIPFEMIPTYISNFDINLYFLPDDEWSKGKCGTRILEAMSMGVPSIASDIGENVYIIESGIDGFLIRNDDDFVDKFSSLISNDDLRFKMGIRGISKVKTYYSLKTVVDDYEKLIRIISST